MPLDDILRKNRVDGEALVLLLRLAQRGAFRAGLLELEERPEWRARLRPVVALLPPASPWRRLRW